MTRGTSWKFNRLTFHASFPSKFAAGLLPTRVIVLVIFIPSQRRRIILFPTDFSASRDTKLRIYFPLRDFKSVLKYQVCENNEPCDFLRQSSVNIGHYNDRVHHVHAQLYFVFINLEELKLKIQIRILLPFLSNRISTASML